MTFLSHLAAMTSALTLNDIVLLIPMALVGVILTSALPYRTRATRFSFEACGAAVGALFALGLVAGMSSML